MLNSHKIAFKIMFCMQASCPPSGGAPLVTRSTTIVQVADSCSTCGPNRLVIPYVIYQETLGASSPGEATVRYRQVDCTPPGSIVVDVDTFRQSGGGYVRLDLQSVAGSGALRSVELRQAGQSVSQMSH